MFLTPVRRRLPSILSLGRLFDDPEGHLTIYNRIWSGWRPKTQRYDSASYVI